MLAPFMLLVVVDSHSKWPEVCKMLSTTSISALEALEMFARFGIPRQHPSCHNGGINQLTHVFLYKAGSIETKYCWKGA